MNSAAASPNQCLECQAPLSAAETQGLCARCLLKLGLASQFGENSVADAGTRRFVLPPLFPFDFGEYRVRRLLGRGGMGAVYEAEQISTGRRVALKVLGHTIDSPEMRKRFLREGRLAASVNHPNSVYIFGTEEIEGAPVIAMELVAGGTLRDQVKGGPLAVRDAVDAILHVIAGLEAAASAGVLHRDVKPANCFVAPDGTVKVGDFGLSVSTLARHDSQLTASGTMLGTPSYAPPEQLRGDELDLRADIYSVGATLYSLLTGRPPFEGQNAVQVVAAVLDQTPKPIGEFRQDVPAGLTQAIGKCLAKKRGERFASYAQLRDALTPFSSLAREPAPLGMRTVAGIIDCMLATMIGIVLLMGAGDSEDYRFLSERTLAATLKYFGVMMIGVVYFAIPEGLWGAALGKMLCGLRVVGAGRGAPGLLPAIFRALLLMLMMNAADFIQLLISSAEEIKRAGADYYGTFYEIAGPSFMLLLFVTMRRRNGFAALQDILTGTRVIVRPKSNARPRLEATSAPAPAPDDAAERIGPFRIVAPIAGDWRAGYDDVLRRSVWLRKCEPRTPPLPPARRDLGRAGRLRWIAGARGENENWDAFDAPAGKAWCELTTQPWAAVRWWLLDLAEELEAASKDGTLPASPGVDHVFITADGRALLLDEPWPGVEPSPHLACLTVQDAQRFLHAVAGPALDATRLPLHARDFLQKLGAAAFDRASFIAGNLRSLLAKPAAITPRQRFASIALAPALALLITIPVVVVQQHEAAQWANRPELQKLGMAVAQYRYLQDRGIPAPGQTKPADEQQMEQLAKYISGRFGEFIASPKFDGDPAFGRWSKEERDHVRAIVQSHPSVKPAEVDAMDGEMEATCKRQIESDRMALYFVAPAILFGTFLVICASQFLSLLIFGATLGQRLFGFAVVNKLGEPAGRARMLLRWLVIWGPLLVGAGALAANGLQLASRLHHIASNCGIALLALSALSFLAGLPWSVLRPAAGPHDMITGTRVLPR